MTIINLKKYQILTPIPLDLTVRRLSIGRNEHLKIWQPSSAQFTLDTYEWTMTVISTRTHSPKPLPINDSWFCLWCFIGTQKSIRKIHFVKFKCLKKGRTNKQKEIFRNREHILNWVNKIDIHIRYYCIALFENMVLALL